VGDVQAVVRLLGQVHLPLDEAVGECRTLVLQVVDALPEQPVFRTKALKKRK
jgi:hypothetical protein